jgi:hypothetical protein
MSRQKAHYTSAQRAEAIGLAITVGPSRAAKQLGLPTRTVTNWMHSPDAVVITQLTRDQVAAKLWEAVVTGTEEVLAGLRDPNARLSDKARALEVVASQHALLTGNPTSNQNINARVAGVTDQGEDLWQMTPEQVQAKWDDERKLTQWIETIEESSDEELAEWLSHDFPGLKAQLLEAKTSGESSDQEGTGQ